MAVTVSLNVISFNLLELINSERLCAAVVICDGVEDLDSFSIAPLTNQILR